MAPPTHQPLQSCGRDIKQNTGPEAEDAGASFQCGCQRLQLCHEIDAESMNDLDDCECDSGCDKSILDRGGAGFIGGEFGQYAFQFHRQRFSQFYSKLPAA